MSTYDTVVFLVIVAFAAAGFKKGLIQSVGSLVGLILGVAIASRYYGQVADTIGVVSFGSEQSRQITAFILVFLVVSQAVGFVAWIIGRAVNLLSVIPGIGLVNRVGGAVLGFLEGLFVIGIILDFATRLTGSEQLAIAIESAQFAQYAVRAAELFTPLLPQALRAVEGLL